jgi:hypothetical protein
VESETHTRLGETNPIPRRGVEETDSAVVGSFRGREGLRTYWSVRASKDGRMMTSARASDGRMMVHEPAMGASAVMVTRASDLYVMHGHLCVGNR